MSDEYWYKFVYYHSNNKFVVRACVCVCLCVCVHVCVCAERREFIYLNVAIICVTLKTTTWLDRQIIIIIIYPSTARVVGAPQMILQPVSSFFPVLHCPLGLAELQACPFPDVVFPHLPLSALSVVFFHLSLYLARWFWPDLMNGRHDHTTAVCVSLR